MKLQHLTLKLLVDAVYRCSLTGEKVNLYIAAPPDTGKTYATKTAREWPGVAYFWGKYSLTEYVLYLQNEAKNAKLFIHDDIGRVSPRYFQDYVAVWAMMGDGEVVVKNYGKTMVAFSPYSVILTSTIDQYHQWTQLFRATGLLNRFLPVKVGISDESAKEYLRGIQIKAWEDTGPSSDGQYPKLDPTPLIRRDAMDLAKLGIGPRHAQSLLSLSRYLPEEALEELVMVLRAPSPVYEI